MMVTNTERIRFASLLQHLVIGVRRKKKKIRMKKAIRPKKVMRNKKKMKVSKLRKLP